MRVSTTKANQNIKEKFVIMDFGIPRSMIERRKRDGTYEEKET